MASCCTLFETCPFSVSLNFFFFFLCCRVEKTGARRKTDKLDGNFLTSLHVDSMVDASKGTRTDAFAELELLVSDLVGD